MRITQCFLICTLAISLLACNNNYDQTNNATEEQEPIAEAKTVSKVILPEDSVIIDTLADLIAEEAALKIAEEVEEEEPTLTSEAVEPVEPVEKVEEAKPVQPVKEIQKSTQRAKGVEGADIQKEVTKNLPETPANDAEVDKASSKISTSSRKAKKGLPKKAQKRVILSPSHMLWDQLLKKYVSSSGKVNYKGFKADEIRLDAYLTLLELNPVQQSWTRNQKMAYWINAYNAFTVKLILKNYPISSITKLDGGKPWDVKWIKLGEKMYSLNNIEHDILRPTYKDARIHFAVNCAAKSCPPLLNRAWTANTLNATLEKQTKTFINNTTFNEIDAGAVKLSKIFEWYKVDFGDLIEYINKYSTIKVSKDAAIEFVDYNWALNQ